MSLQNNQQKARWEEVFDLLFNDVVLHPPKPVAPELTPGQLVKGQGVFAGTWEPKDRDGKSLGKIFNVFAAPQDLPETMKYVGAVKHIAKLKGWNGFDGTHYATDKEIYKALKDGSYDGGWIIPTRDILRGNDVDGKDTTPDNFFAHQNRGAFKGTFKTATASVSRYPGWYWSSTEDRDTSSCVRVVCFSGGYENWFTKDNFLLSCRPVRLVEASAPAPAPQ